MGGKLVGIAMGELWNTSGTRRAITLPSPLSGKGILVFRDDGKTVFVLGTDVIAVDIASGRANVVQWSGPTPEPGRSVRVTS